MKIERVKQIYDEITKYEIALEPDPRSLGPLYLQNVISQCRNFLNAVSRVALEVHREKQDIARTIHATETEYDVTFSELLTNDERVRRLPSIEDRKAHVSTMLRDRLANLTNLKGEAQDLEYVEKAVRHRHRELTSTMAEIKLQRSLIRDEIDSGAMYGDERRNPHERGKDYGSPGGETDINEAELDRLLNAETQPETPAEPEMAEEEAKVRVHVVPENVVPPVDEKAVEEESVKAFLDEPEKDVFADILEQV